ncbi:hypothetical protein ABW20_dc0102107 [Dactylellina cionopaga]|nr:hypothetical protein ABW20_dc0102107 [Dactylellina cionopaga]
MLFFKTALTTALAVLSVPAFSALTAQQMVGNIRTLTTKSQALQAPAQSINIVNGPLIIIGLGPFPQLIAGFSDIIATTTTAIAQMQGSGKVGSAGDATAIADAFREFVRVHQVLLNILIGKAGLFNTVPLIGQPVAAVLRQLESIVDTIAFAAIDFIDTPTTVTSKNDVTSSANNLHGTIEITISSYDGLSLRKRHVRDFQV